MPAAFSPTRLSPPLALFPLLIGLCPRRLASPPHPLTPQPTHSPSSPLLSTYQPPLSASGLLGSPPSAPAPPPKCSPSGPPPSPNRPPPLASGLLATPPPTSPAPPLALLPPLIGLRPWRLAFPPRPSTPLPTLPTPPPFLLPLPINLRPHRPVSPAPPHRPPCDVPPNSSTSKN